MRVAGIQVRGLRKMGRGTVEVVGDGLEFLRAEREEEERDPM
jgi:hypothetical protein